MIVLKKIYRNKYRPKNIEGTILLPRIKKELLDGNNEFILANHYLFSGSPGIGKTTLAKIIVPSGALIVNASYNSSVEDLKEQVIDYCRTSDIFEDATINGFKIVFLDEFDGVSQKYQEALRAFMEEYDDRVRFIATCNNLSKISPAMQSRFTVFKFDPETEEETQYLKQEYLERALLIKEKNNINIEEEQISSIININFPDLRSVFNTLQRAEVSGSYNKTMNTSINVDLYNIVFEMPDPEKTYAWVMNNFGDNVENLLKLCARPLTEYIFENKKKYMNKVPMLMKIVANYTTNLNNCVDPVILALSCIYEIQEIINK
jgi:DNA polymerase III delta prime subunit